MRIIYKGALIIFVPLALELGLGSSAAWLFNQSQEKLAQEQTARTIVSCLTAMQQSLLEISAAGGKYMVFEDAAYLENMVAHEDAVYRELTTLDRLLASDPANRDEVSALRSLFDQWRQAHEKMIYFVRIILPEKAEQRQGELRRKNIAKYREASQLSYRLLDQMKARQTRLLASYEARTAEGPEAQRRLATSLNFLFAGGAALNTVLAVLMLRFFARNINSRLGVVARNTARLAKQEELLPEVRGDDEINLLDQAFRKMSLALQESAQRERAILKNAADVIFSLDGRARLVTANEAACEVWGYEPAELIGTAMTDLLPSSAKLTLIRGLKAARAAGSSDFDSSLIRKDGRQIQVVWTVRHDPSNETFFCVTHDFTARKEAEDALKESEGKVRTILANMPVGLLIYDRSGKIELCNAYGRTVIESTGSSLTAGTIHSVIPAQSDDLFSDDRREFDIALTLGGDRCLTVRSVVAGLPAPSSGLSDKFVLIFQDVSAQKELERFKQEVYNMVSHDLRTPLSSLKITMSAWKEGAFGPVGESALRTATRAEASISRLISLINDLLDVEKLAAGQMSLHQEYVPVEVPIRAAVDSVESFARAFGIEIIVEHGEDDVYADADRITQVLVNLLSNSIKFSPQGSKICLSARRSGDIVEYSVRDQERGIPDDQRDRVFQKFAQVERSDATKKKGTGLGLAICKAIVESHGGTIGFESTVGQGSTFWFRLPDEQSTQESHGG